MKGLDKLVVSKKTKCLQETIIDYHLLLKYLFHNHSDILHQFQQKIGRPIKTGLKYVGYELR